MRMVPPSPLVGEGGIGDRRPPYLEKDADALHRLWTRSGSETGEGSVSADRDPSSVADCVRATFSHKGRRSAACVGRWCDSKFSLRHCERSDLSAEAQRAKAEAIHSAASGEVDCFAALAMTVWRALVGRVSPTESEGRGHWRQGIK